MKRVSAVLGGLMVFILLTAGVFAAGGSYRDQLDATEAKIYDSMLENIENREKTFTHTFSPELQYTDEKRAQSELQTMTFRAYEAFYRDHPEIFWVNKNGGISVKPDLSLSGGFCVARGITITTSFTDESRIAQKQQELESAVASLMAQATGSDYERVMAVHDAIVAKCAYNMQAKTDVSGQPDAYEAYGALVNGSAVCEGYSKAMKLLCDRMGIPCVLIGGTANGEAHMWNYVRLDGSYYLLDATFDDPVGGSPTKDYFLKGSDSTTDHKPGGGFLQGFDSKFIDPPLSKADYRPGRSSSSSGGQKAEDTRSFQVFHGCTRGGSYEIKLSGSTTGGIDNGQWIEKGTVVEVWALPKEGYEIEEIEIVMGDKTISDKWRNQVYFKVTGTCHVTVRFKPES